jgi:hypothetical protein
MNVIFAILMVILGQNAEAFESGTAPFCAVDNYGNKQCFYYTMDACEAAIKFDSGKFCGVR